MHDVSQDRRVYYKKLPKELATVYFTYYNTYVEIQ